jgi:hypothetical protein
VYTCVVRVPSICFRQSFVEMSTDLSLDNNCDGSMERSLSPCGVVCAGIVRGGRCNCISI